MKVLGIIILIIFLICMIPVGIDFNFEDEKFSLSLKVCGKLLKVLPKKKIKKKKPEPKPKEPKPEIEKPKKKKGGLPNLHLTKEDLFFLVKKVLYKLGRFNRSFNVDRFLLHFIAAGRDPYNVAKEFAYVNAALSSLAPFCERRFNCKDVDVWTDCDFDEYIPTIDIGFAIVIRIGAFFVLIFGILNSAIAMLVRSRCSFFYEKHFDKEAYEYRLESEQKIPALKFKIDRIKAVVRGSSDNAKSTLFKIERTGNNNA